VRNENGVQTCLRSVLKVICLLGRERERQSQNFYQQKRFCVLPNSFEIERKKVFCQRGVIFMVQIWKNLIHERIIVMKI
jgi:hypothetical protein